MEKGYYQNNTKGEGIMKKRILVIILSTVLMLALSACSKEVTAENLVEDAFSEVDYVEFQLNWEVLLTGEESGYKTESKAGMAVAGKISKLVSFREVEFTYLTKVPDLGYEDESVSEYYEYCVIEDGKEYYYIKDGVWERHVFDTNNNTRFPVFDESMFEDLVLETLDTGYKVTGKIVDEYPISVLEGGTITEILDQVGECEKYVTFLFNEENVLQKYEILIDLEEDKLYETEILGDNYMSDIKIEIELISCEGEVSIPEDVVNNAVDAGANEGTEDETEADKQEEGIRLGVIVDDTYSNESLKLKYEIPKENWKLLSRDEIDKVYNASIVILKDDLGNLLANNDSVMDLYAMNTTTMANINMMIEKLSSTGEIKDETTYYNGLKETLPSIYAGFGYEDVEIQVGDVEFLGETHKCLISEYTYMSMRIYSVQVIVYEGKYQAIISSGSYKNIEEAKAAFAYFKRINE